MRIKFNVHVFWETTLEFRKNEQKCVAMLQFNVTFQMLMNGGQKRRKLNFHILMNPTNQKIQAKNL